MPLTARPLGGVLALVIVFVAGFGVPGSSGEIGRRRVIDVAIRGAKVQSGSAEDSGGVPVIRVRQGQRLLMRWSSDTETKIHLHGYNIEIRVPRDGQATMDFVARAAGRFPVERHESHGHAALLYLEVRP